MQDTFARFIEAVDYLKNNGRIHKQQDLADAMGMGKSRISEALKGKSGKFTDGFVKSFAAAFSEYVNEEWLLEGKGEMAKIDEKALRPHIPLKVSAGYTDTSIGTAMEGDCRRHPLIGGFPYYDFTIEVSGDSMMPTLMDGDRIACAWVTDPNEIDDEKIYVLDTKDGAVVKQIFKTGDEVVCHSLNPMYRDFRLRSESITKLARVVGIVRQL